MKRVFWTGFGIGFAALAVYVAVAAALMSSVPLPESPLTGVAFLVALVALFVGAVLAARRAGGRRAMHGAVAGFLGPIAFGILFFIVCALYVIRALG